MTRKEGLAVALKMCVWLYLLEQRYSCGLLRIVFIILCYSMLLENRTTWLFSQSLWYAQNTSIHIIIYTVLVL